MFSYDIGRVKDMNVYDIFVEVVELKSLSAAAKKLHRSPSAISKQINLLEQKLNVQLLNRTTRSLSVTEAGRIYYVRCKDISQRMNDAESELKDLSGEPSGIINITWPEPLSNSRAVEVLSQFTQKFPDIKARVKVTSEVLDLTDENIDFAFRIAPLVDSSMIAVELFGIDPVVCAAPNIVEHYGLPEKIDDLASMPHIFESHINLSQKIRQLFPNLKFNNDDHHQVSNYAALQNMAIKGMGAAILFRHAVEKELENGSLIDLAANVTLPSLPVYMMYQRLNYTPKKTRYFIDFFRTQFQSADD
jgi:DNA-binding transcriptional LysR family regulator